MLAIGDLAMNQALSGLSQANQNHQLISIGPALEIDERSVSRKKLSAPAAILPKKHSWGKAQLLDLSTHGCCVNSETRSLMVGEFVSVKFGGLGYVRGIVRWVSGEQAGLEFAQPLHSAVFRHLGGEDL